jgi:hypothetical protein
MHVAFYTDFHCPSKVKDAMSPAAVEEQAQEAALVEAEKEATTAAAAASAVPDDDHMLVFDKEGVGKPMLEPNAMTSQCQLETIAKQFAGFKAEASRHVSTSIKLLVDTGNESALVDGLMSSAFATADGECKTLQAGGEALHISLASTFNLSG